MKLNNINHVFFDLDHTLWDFDKNSELAFIDVFQKNAITVPISEFLAVYMPINLKYWRMYRNNHVSKDDLRYGRLKESFDFLKYKITDELINILAVDYIDYLPRYNHLLKDTVPVLETMGKKYDLHIITNGFDEVQRKKLKNSGIDKYFSSVTTSEEVGVKKPDSFIFEKAIEKSGGAVSNSLMVGDSIEADILGAQNIGMQAIYFNYYKSEMKANYVEIRELSELLKYL